MASPIFHLLSDFSKLTSTVSFTCAACFNVIFWSLSLICFCFDFLVANCQQKEPTSKYLTLGQRLAQRKLRETQPPLTRAQFLEVFLTSAFNVLVIPVLMIPFLELVWQNLHGNDRMSPTDAWNYQRELPRLLSHTIVLDAIHFFTHYWLHASPFLYRNIHKVHHKYHSLTTIMAAYAHPLEFSVSNILGAAMGPILSNAHPYTAYSWFAMTALLGCKAHCGYDILGSHVHDAHHQFNNANYGTCYALDIVAGTLMWKSTKGGVHLERQYS